MLVGFKMADVRETEVATETERSPSPDRATEVLVSPGKMEADVRDTEVVTEAVELVAGSDSAAVMANKAEIVMVRETEAAKETILETQVTALMVVVSIDETEATVSDVASTTTEAETEAAVSDVASTTTDATIAGAAGAGHHVSVRGS